MQLPPGTRAVARAILTELLGEPRSIKGRGQVIDWDSVTLRHRDITWIQTPRNNEAVDAVRAACKLIAP